MDSQEMNNSTDNYQDNTSVYQQEALTEEQQESKKINALSIISLVLGILSILICCCTWIGLLFGIAGLICGIIGKKKSPSGIGTAGIICSIIGLLLSGLILTLAIIGFATNPEIYMEQFENMMM